MTSSPCTANIALEPIEPSTQAIGDQFLCDDEPGLYKLDITPPPSSAITWSVSPSNATTPSSGIGESATTSASGSYNGNATITFTINTLCGTKTRQKTFFVGRPKITNVKVDGKSGTFVYICPNDGLGSHWISLSLQGDQNNCIDEWDDFGTTAESHETCTEFDFTLQYNPNNNPPYNCVFVNAIASNECGITTQNIIACPSYWACKDVKYAFEISPNPASTTVNVELYLDKNGNREQVDFDFIQLIDNHGNMLQSHQVTDQSIQLDVSNLQKGLYYLRTWIDEGYVMEELLIEK
ncbi:MAG: T9SS C-terminal target domain-containing protein [Bacteroidetes bacterium]|nr:MAG: T9SS C-terminal target domain-containing protein [Bacteroidota bacterium]